MNEEIKKIIALISGAIEKGSFGIANEHTKTLNLLFENVALQNAKELAQAGEIWSNDICDYCQNEKECERHNKHRMPLMCTYFVGHKLSLVANKQKA